VVHNLCFGDNTGKIKVTPSNNTSPLEYTWSTGSMADSIVNLFSSVYSLKISESTDFGYQVPINASCTPVTTNYCCALGIFKVVLNNLDKNSFSGVEGYRDFTNEKAIVDYGQTNKLEVTTGAG